MRDSNLILFNYYLLRNDKDNKTKKEENKILNEILSNIEKNYQLQINNIFKKLNKFDKLFDQETLNGNGEKLKDWLEFKKIVLGEVIVEEGNKGLKNSHLNFKEKLVYDLKMALKNFNLMFKENIDGFYIIMKSIRDEDNDTQEDINNQGILNERDLNVKKSTSLEENKNISESVWVASSDENSDNFFKNDTKRRQIFKIPEVKRKNEIIQSTINKINYKSSNNKDNHEELDDDTKIFDNFIDKPSSLKENENDVLALSPSSVSSYASSPKEEWEITSDILSKESSNEIINFNEIDKAVEISNIDIDGFQTYKKNNRIKSDNNRDHKENHYKNFKPLKLVQKRNSNSF
ncbi:hypothetical protein B5S32_g5683 [[Candida] boidinii]|nr:hypothetical protein B5S32_g5683 [[Candida] boidinii]